MFLKATIEGNLKAAMQADKMLTNMSAQMLRAQDSAYLPSSSLAAADTPPAPCTGITVFFAAS